MLLGQVLMVINVAVATSSAFFLKESHVLQRTNGVPSMKFMILLNMVLQSGLEPDTLEYETSVIPD